MAITKSRTTAAKSTKVPTAREVIGYWNPRHLIDGNGGEHKFKSQYGVTLYADDPFHVLILESALAQDKPVHLVGTVTSSIREELDISSLQV